MSDDVKALRGKFELMAEISEKLTRASLYFYKPDGVYVAKTISDDDQFDCDFVNGAWYAFQEQQKELDKMYLINFDSELHLDAAKEEIQRLNSLIGEISRIVHEAHMSDGNSSVEIVYELIQEVLK